MESQLFVAVDGGASTTRLVAVDGDGRVRGRATAGPTSLTLVGAAGWRVILEAAAEAGVAARELAAVRFGLGLAGANDRRQREAFLAAAPAVGGLALATDAYTALLGAHGGEPGAVVICGTGSVGCRLLPDGRLKLVGGWGFPVGDEGSGAWIGWRAMGLALRALDGRAAETPLTHAVRARGGHWRDDLLDWLRGAPSTRYAELAPLAVAEAGRGDAAAQAILAAAGQELLHLATALDGERRTKLALVGGMVASLTPYLPPELAAWARPARGDALDGALRLARGEAPPERLAP